MNITFGARSLDIARWQYHFEGVGKDVVLIALADYQDEDDGLGHVLEPEASNPNSAPIQKCMAIEILSGIDFADSTNPIMRRIMHYLASGQDLEVKLR